MFQKDQHLGQEKAGVGSDNISSFPHAFLCSWFFHNLHTVLLLQAFFSHFISSISAVIQCQYTVLTSRQRQHLFKVNFCLKFRGWTQWQAKRAFQTWLVWMLGPQETTGLWTPESRCGHMLSLTVINSDTSTIKCVLTRGVTNKMILPSRVPCKAVAAANAHCLKWSFQIFCICGLGLTLSVLATVDHANFTVRWVPVEMITD